MRQKFFTNTIQSNFIKALVYNTPVPTIRTVNDYSYIIAGNTYIYGPNIIKCTRSGIVKYPQLDDHYSLLYKNGDLKTDFDFLSYNKTIQEVDSVTGEGTLPSGQTKYVNYFFTLQVNAMPGEYDGGAIQPWSTTEDLSGGTIADWEESSDDFYGGKIWPWYIHLVPPYEVQNGNILGVVFKPGMIPDSFNYYFIIEGVTYKVIGLYDGVAAGVTQYFKYNAAAQAWSYLGTESPALYADNQYEGLGYKFVGPASYQVVDRFLFGKYYPEFTELYHSNSSYYDSAIHEHLGALLRCYRDVSGINLMPYYNCFSGQYISGVTLTDEKIIEWETRGVKILKIPIKFNTTYTVAIDCNSPVKMAPALLSRDVLIHSFSTMDANNVYADIDLTEDLYNGNIYNFDSLSFKAPVKVGVDIANTETEKYLAMYEKFLYLLIQLPAGNTSSVAVLEGDYTHPAPITSNVFSIEQIDALHDLTLSEVMRSDLSLLQLSDGVSYPFADRLIEYLSLNVITSMEVIPDNIRRIQKGVPNYGQISGVWNNALRSYIYNYYQKQSSLTHLDLNGFVDKDTEQLINKQVKGS